MQFEHNIASARKKAKLSQAVVAKEMKMKLRTYQAKESGERAMSASEGITFSIITNVEAKKIDFRKEAQKNLS
ncbi:hypothetical protein [Culicoidibacter larvae]|uniref:Helix-turn-helix transcriptional regulator n=1 Tax=Culicoidibacter larvae TaxID=2579976 RepID=A0A5R8Q8P9_9FIRM|nr:hypothetical protein [Culicoidibacter larvae]TLG72092.1 hypothetical protein FEZ08_09675 [Culicoidibacter larvae]